MRTLCLVMFLFCYYSGNSQDYFFEDFNYENFQELDSIFSNGKSTYRWTTPHSRREIDINENGFIDNIELYKRTTIVPDPFDSNNKIIRYELNKIDPYFFAKYNCDDSRNDNVISDEKIANSLDKNMGLYCIDCSNSPLGYAKYEYKTHMMRNEMSTYGAKQKLYKPNRSHWFGMDMLIDDEYELDTDNNGEIVTQFHLTGKKVINPPVSLVVLKNRFRLTIIENNDGVTEVYDLGPVEKGKWIKWKYHLVLSKKGSC